MKKLIIIFALFLSVVVSTGHAGETARPAKIEDVEYTAWTLKSQIGEMEIWFLPKGANRNPNAAEYKTWICNNCTYTGVWTLEGGVMKMAQTIDRTKWKGFKTFAVGPCELLYPEDDDERRLIISNSDDYGKQSKLVFYWDSKLNRVNGY
jgi:hypothetical protein